MKFVLPFAFVLSVAAAVACAGAPRQRQVETTPIDTSKDSSHALRLALEGKWRLLSLDVTAPDGRRTNVEADGELSMDAFGNLHIEYRMREEGRAALRSLGVESPNPVVSTDGRAAIDPAQRRITYIAPDAAQRAFDPDLAARRRDPFAMERVRYYSLGSDGVLTLTTRHDDGRDASVSRWQKVQ